MILMVCTTILHTNEQKTKTSSKEINTIVESINSYLVRDKYVVHEISYPIKKLFKTKLITYYNIFYLYNEGDTMVQQISLHRNDYDGVICYLRGVESGVSEQFRH